MEKGILFHLSRRQQLASQRLIPTSGRRRRQPSLRSNARESCVYKNRRDDGSAPSWECCCPQVFSVRISRVSSRGQCSARRGNSKKISQILVHFSAKEENAFMIYKSWLHEKFRWQFISIRSLDASRKRVSREKGRKSSSVYIRYIDRRG